MIGTNDFGTTGGFFSIPLQAAALGVRARRDSAKGRGPRMHQFIGDDQNHLIPVAADAALQTVPRFIPILFHGPTGTGKTFLARGLVHLWNARHAQSTAVITSGADFAREYSRANVTDSLADFRKRFRSPAMLMIDDLDRMQDKVSAQDELTHTLDELTQNRSQVLITMKAAPLATAGLSPGLVSRLSSGLSVPVTTPGHEGRKAILAELLKLHRVRLTDPAMELLTGSSLLAPVESATSFSDLNHLVTSLAAQMGDNRTEFDVDDVRSWLADRQSTRAIPMNLITRRVSKYFQLQVADLKGPSRQQRVVRARGVAMFLARQWTGKSLEQVGRHYGRRDHTTVLHACRKTKELMATDPAIRQAIDDLSKWLAAR